MFCGFSVWHLEEANFLCLTGSADVMGSVSLFNPHGWPYTLAPFISDYLPSAPFISDYICLLAHLSLTIFASWPHLSLTICLLPHLSLTIFASWPHLSDYIGLLAPFISDYIYLLTPFILDYICLLALFIWLYWPPGPIYLWLYILASWSHFSSWLFASWPHLFPLHHFMSWLHLFLASFISMAPFICHQATSCVFKPPVLYSGDKSLIPYHQRWGAIM